MGVSQVSWLVFLSLIISSHGAPRFANYIQDHMVLQRAPQRAIVWGYGDAGVVTTLRMNDKVYRTISSFERANDRGESIWSVTLDPVSDEGPFDIHVTQPSAGGTNVTITIHDVLFGDVWICSGQSNMQMTVGMAFNATEEIANAGKYPKIRVFTAALVESLTPVEELLGIVLNWSLSSPQSIGGPTWDYMSATCWYYGRQIHQALNGRPIGLIATSWGGTTIEVWMPPKALQDCNDTTTSTNANANVESFDYFPRNHSGLYNSMIYPLTRLVVYGSIWYQGNYVCLDISTFFNSITCI